MSYGLNIEMHKQVDILMSVFSVCICSFLFDSLPLSLFALPLLRQGFVIYLVCVLVYVSLCVHRCISSFVRARVCVHVYL